jgi:hypothetical protein
MTDRRIVVADLRLNAVRAIGREGAGAGEYAAPRYLFPLGGDSTLASDPRNGRWMALVGDAIAAIIAGDSPGVRTAGPTLLGADHGGAVLVTRPRIVGARPSLDSLLVLRVHRASGRADTVVVVRNRPVQVQASGPIDPTRSVPITINPLAVAEQPALFADGWIAIARLAPYRVDWVAPDGRLTRGAALPFTGLRVDDAEKQYILAWESRETGRPARALAEVGDWPDLVPPFPHSLPLAAPDGMLWIRRIPSRGAPEERYDVIRRDGTLARQIALPPGARVVGFGDRSYYVATPDSDGVERLSRHPFPR